MKKLFVFLIVVGLVMTGTGKASAQAYTPYNLYATTQNPWIGYASDFQLRYNDLDGDQKFSVNEPFSFSGVTWSSTTYTEILEVPYNNFDSPFTDGSTSNVLDWYFNKPSSVATTVYIDPNVWHYTQVPGSELIVSVAGKMILSDPEGDFNLRNCDPDYPLIPCSVRPGASLDLPGYLDIRQAGITQIGRRMVDLTIKVNEPIPPEPPYGFVSYFWQFEGGCVGNNPPTGDKSGINVTWSDGAWKAQWAEIKSCLPRESVPGDPVPFVFTENGIRVRVPLDDLLTAIDTEGQFLWHSGVRLVPFSSQVFEKSVAVDNAPNIFAFRDPFPSTSPFGWTPESPVTWEPR